MNIKLIKIIIMSSMMMFSPIMVAEQAALSQADLARLKAFVGDVGRVGGLGNAGSESVNGVYKVRSGDTLAKIIQKEFKQVGINRSLLTDVIVAVNPHAFRRGNPHWLLAGAALKLPSTADFQAYIFPKMANKKDSSSKDWIRYP
jgi:Tfp pilus assembly protein FimV